jgi:hypothetical protein
MVIWLQLQILTRHFTAILRQHVFNSPRHKVKPFQRLFTPSLNDLADYNNNISSQMSFKKYDLAGYENL